MAMMTSPLAVHGDPLLSTAYRTPSPLLGKSEIPLHGHGHGPDTDKVRARCRVKGKVFPYSLPSVGPGADPGVQAVSPQVA